MGPIEFIEKNVKDTLAREGFDQYTSVKWKEFVSTTNDGFKYEIGAIGWLQLGE